MSIADIIDSFINNGKSLKFEDIIDKLKQILKKHNSRGYGFILNDEQDILSRCQCAESEYKRTHSDNITDLHKVAFFCYALIENIDTGFPIKIKGLSENVAGDITSFLATFTAFEFIQSNITEADIKLIAKAFLDSFKGKNLKINTILFILKSWST